MEERTIRGLEFFDSWLKEKMKYAYDLKACVEDLITNREINGKVGYTDYELSPWETKSGRPELFSYRYEYEWDEEADELIYEFYDFHPGDVPKGSPAPTTVDYYDIRWYEFA